MKILFASSQNLDKRALYIHTRGRSESVKNLEDGTVIEPAEIVIYEDENANGETNTITSIVDTAGKHYTTNSRIFREELGVIWKLMEGEAFSLVVRKNLSKAGRTFVTCELA